MISFCFTHIYTVHLQTICMMFIYDSCKARISVGIISKHIKPCTDWKQKIKKQEETVLKVKEKYDSEMMKLKDLYAKRNEEKKKELLKTVENSTKTYEEIMAFICSEDEIN